MSKYHIVGNHMSRLNYGYNANTLCVTKQIDYRTEQNRTEHYKLARSTVAHLWKSARLQIKLWGGWLDPLQNLSASIFASN